MVNISDHESFAKVFRLVLVELKALTVDVVSSDAESWCIIANTPIV